MMLTPKSQELAAGFCYEEPDTGASCNRARIAARSLLLLLYQRSWKGVGGSSISKREMVTP